MIRAMILVLVLILAGPLAAADQAPRPPQAPPIAERVTALERRVTTLETKVLGLGTAGATVPTGVCRCVVCQCADGKPCGDPACPAVTKTAPAPLPPAPAFEQRAGGLDFYHYRGQRWQVPAGHTPRWPDGVTATAPVQSCAGGSCGFGQYDGPQNAGQRLMYFQGGGCAGGNCPR